MLENRPERLLLAYSTCVVCQLPNDLTYKNKEHVFPAMLSKKYRFIDGFGDLIDDHANLTLVHPGSHHREIDDVKIELCRKAGILGGIEYMTCYYPRFVDQSLLEIQRGQWIWLLDEMRNLLAAQRVTTYPHVEDFPKAVDLADKYLMKWQQGNFGVAIQAVA